MAVWSNNPMVDPCRCLRSMGPVRVNSIVDELRGEKIDIVCWDENPGNLIQNALSPAKIVRFLQTRMRRQPRLLYLIIS